MSDKTAWERPEDGIKAILFDRDGTLLDLQATWADATYMILHEMTDGNRDLMERLSQEGGYDLKARRFLDGAMLLTTAPDDFIDDWAAICGKPDRDAFWETFERVSLHYSTSSATLLPGVQQALDLLHEHKIPMGIATNGTESSARKQMQHLGLEEHFCFICGCDSGFGQKPEPGQVLAFAEHLCMDPGDVLMVGDSLHDIRAGLAAGSLTLGLPTGAGSLDELSREADQILHSLSDLPTLLGFMSSQTPPTARPSPFALR